MLTMAVDDALAAAVIGATAGDTVIVIDVVRGELEHRATIPATAELANRALMLKPADWVEMATDRYVTLENVLQAQEDVADGRPLTDERQHWAESTIIALARRSANAGTSTTLKVLLSEDFEARRVAAGVPDMTSISVHGLLHRLIHVSSTLTAEQAARFAASIEATDRGKEVNAADFGDATGRSLGRVGLPRPQF